MHTSALPLGVKLCTRWGDLFSRSMIVLMLT